MHDRTVHPLYSFLLSMYLITGSICLSVSFIIHNRLFYPLLIGPLKLVSNSGLSVTEILTNYNTLIDYCSPFFHGTLQFPTLPSSANALSHFAEVKAIFSAIDFLALSCPFAALCFLNALSHNIQSRILKKTGRCLMAVPPYICLFLLFDFHTLFEKMHHVLFRNNDWIFRSDTDPIILLLPEQYFLCCGLAILALIVLCGLCCRSVAHHLAQGSSHGKMSTSDANPPLSENLPLHGMLPTSLPVRQNTSGILPVTDPSAAAHPFPKDCTACKDMSPDAP